RSATWVWWAVPTTIGARSSSPRWSRSPVSIRRRPSPPSSSSGAEDGSRTTSVPGTSCSSTLCRGTTTGSSTSTSCASSSEHSRFRRTMGICDGRVVIVTGSGRGIGREHALTYAREGAKVVVNDLGRDMHGDGGSLSPAMEVVEEIKAMGGEAVADGENVADFAGAGRMVQRAIDTFGRLDTLVNNAG